MRISAVLVALCCAASASAAPADTAPAEAPADAVHTSLAPVHACLPLIDQGAGARFLAATDGGLVLVSAAGERLAVWTALDGLPGTRMRALAQDRGDLWIGGESGAARVRIGSTLEVLERHDAGPVHAILRSREFLYLGTWGRGVMRLSQAGLAPVPFEVTRGRDDARARITSLAEHDGVLIAGTAGRGLQRMDGERMIAHELAGTLVWSLLVRDGALWIGTVDGLYNLANGRARRIADGDVRNLSAGPHGIRAARFGDGVNALSGTSWRGIGAPPASAHALAYAESAGASCIAAHDGLWLQPTPASPWRAAELHGLPSSDISALAADGERLWAGTFDRGLAVHEHGRWRTVASERIDSKINALAVSESKLWVATANGLSIVAGDHVTRLDERDGLPDSHVLSVAPLRAGGVIVGTTRGAALVTGGSVTVLGSKQGILIGNVWAVAESRDGWLWLGTTKGLYRVGPKHQWQRFSLASGHLRDDWVMALAEKDGSLWIGMYKGGVTRLDRTAQDTYQATPISAGWINPSGLAWQNGTLYAATMDGLLAGDGARLAPHAAQPPGRDTTAIAYQGNRLWIASRRGLRATTP